DQGSGIHVAVFQLAVAQVVPHEELLAQLRMLAYALDQLFGFPADLAYKAEPGVLSFRPELFEGVQQKTVILAGLNGADHQIDTAFLEHLLEFLAHCGSRVGLVKVATEVKVVIPALSCCFLTYSLLHLLSHLLDDGLRNGYKSVGGVCYPVEPVGEYSYQGFVTELRVCERYQIVDH